MNVVFWGTRGSIPISITANMIEAKVKSAIQAASGKFFANEQALDAFIKKLPFAEKGTYGCNTSCIEIRDPESDEAIICDAGSGLRDLGNYFLTQNEPENYKGPFVFHIFISHLHWDHIHGFPFFVPAYRPGNIINIYGFHMDMESSFARQQHSSNFPVELSAMQAEIHFHQLELDKKYTINGFTVQGIEQNHPGTSYGYSFTKGDKKVIYSTDAEHYNEADKPDYPMVGFCQNADLLIFDAQYTFVDTITSKLHWGHSSNMIAVELAIRAKAKRLCLFHNEPTNSDNVLDQRLKDARRYARLCPDPHKLDIYMGYDGLQIEI